MASKPVILRDFKKSDAPALSDFFMTLGRETLFFWNRFGTSFEPARARKVADAQAAIPVKQEKGFVACDGNKIVGYCYLRFFPDKPQKAGTASLGMVVADRYQNRGIGRRMMKTMIDYCRLKRMKKIWLATYTDNKRTRPFYESFGFIPEGVFLFDEFFKTRPRHVLSMARFLVPSVQKQAVRLVRRYLVGAS